MIQEYYRQFSGLTEWKQKVVAKGRKLGYVETITGRRRRLPDLMSKDSERRSRAERQAVNAVVQGSAADLCKQAMIDIDRAFKGTNLKVLVQVHDELVAVAPEDEASEMKELFIKAMGHGNMIQGVPLRVSCDIAATWAEAKG
jgi:DNA polymerase-1